MEYKEEVNSLHDKAMDLAEEAFLLQKQGKLEEAERVSSSAFIIEYGVFNYIHSLNDPTLEPTRSTICQSAMYLARDAKQFAHAKKLAEQLLEYNVYAEYTNNAKELLKELNK